MYSDNGETCLKGIPLFENSKRRLAEHHKYVSQKRDVSAVCVELIDSLVEFLNERFEIDTELLKILKPFATLETTSDLKMVHSILGKDLNLTDLSLEYTELLEHDKINQFRQLSLADLIPVLVSSQQFMTVTTILARILAAKPHSADVERLISTSNTLKSKSRSRLSVESENEYLYIYHNMPPLNIWNPRPAVRVWLAKRERRIKETVQSKEQAWYNPWVYFPKPSYPKK